MNILKTRIQYLYDTEDSWADVQNTAKPLRGELVFYAMNNKTVQLKVGDGNKRLSELPFVSFEEPVRYVEEIASENFDSGILHLTYTGQYQQPLWPDYDPKQILITGDIYGLEPGTYETKFYPQHGYRWKSYKDNKPLTFKWYIEINEES